MNRRKMLMVGLVYALAVAAILAAVLVVTGIWPGARAARPTVQAALSTPAVDPNVPTIRPIWPAGAAAGAAKGTRTATPAPSATAGTQQIALAPGTRATSTPEATKSGQGAPTATATALAPGSQATLVPTPTGVPPTSTPAPTNAPGPVPPTATPTRTTPSTPLPSGSISGQVQVKRAAPSRPLTLMLETTRYVIITSTLTTADGSYLFSHVADLPEGYNVLFSQDANPDLQPEIEKYAAWAWLGPVRVKGAEVRLPAFDIALLTRNQQQWFPITPASDAGFEPGEAIQFEWHSFADNSQYWLDITRGQNRDAVWQSPLQMQTKATWSGVGAGGQRQPGEYWWAIGARWGVAPSYTFTIYSNFTRFELK